MRRLISAFSLCILLLASVSEAETHSYVHTVASGGSSATVNIFQTVSGAPSTIITINGKEIVNTNSATTTPPSAGKQLVTPPAPKPRESNRQIINRIRESKHRIEQNITQIVQNGYATGTVRIYREENGTVLQDETLPLPAGNPNAPVSISLLQRIPAVTSPHGTLIRQLASGTSNAIFLRATTSGFIPLFDPSRVLASRFGTHTDTNGDVFISVIAGKPFETFFEKMFGMFGFTANRHGQQMGVIQ